MLSAINMILILLIGSTRNQFLADASQFKIREEIISCMINSLQTFVILLEIFIFII